jgi:hypothetical protein
MIPVPSEARSVKPKLWRATTIKSFEGNAELIHRQEAIRHHEQDIFVQSPCGLLIPGATTPSEFVLQKACLQQKAEGRHHCPPPQPRSHPLGKKLLGHPAPLTDDEILHKLFPLDAFPDRAPKAQLAQKFEGAVAHRIEDSLSPQPLKPAGRRTFPEVVQMQDERSKSIKGDASLAAGHQGVRKVHNDIRSRSCEPITGFPGMLTEVERKTGTKKIQPFSQIWDPLGLKAACNSGGHPPWYSGNP